MTYCGDGELNVLVDNFRWIGEVSRKHPYPVCDNFLYVLFKHDFALSVPYEVTWRVLILKKGKMMLSLLKVCGSCIELYCFGYS